MGTNPIEFEESLDKTEELRASFEQLQLDHHKLKNDLKVASENFQEEMQIRSTLELQISQV